MAGRAAEADEKQLWSTMIVGKVMWHAGSLFRFQF